ncbi:MAG: DUF2218 domain-containing protein [Pseudomonadota bacterium]
MQAFATFKTQEARRYVDNLCTHFGPQASREEARGSACISFAFGECELAHEDGVLLMRAKADDAVQLGRLTDTMTRYLERVAFREDPRLRWRSAEEHSTKHDFTGPAGRHAPTQPESKK